MCDTIPGELLLSFHRGDPAAQALVERLRGGAIEHVKFKETLSDRLRDLHLKPRELELEFCRLQVPEGQEAFKVNYLQFWYKQALIEALATRRMDPRIHGHIVGRSELHPQIVPHSVLSVAGLGFQFDAVHQKYAALMAASASGGSGRDRTVLVLDTGVDKTAGFNVVSECNFVDPTRPRDAQDDQGHGTAVASIIRYLCPDAQVVAFKVADASGRASEWDLMAALAAQSAANVVNISLEFGLGGTTCATCGRESHQSRSAVFENLIGQVVGSPHGPIVVAAAGNSTKNELAYPSRFGSVVAVESVNSQKYLSQFSNRGTVDEAGRPHTKVYLAPGGDDAAPQESVGSSNLAPHYWGTSFSAAYASGIVARVWSDPANLTKDRAQILAQLQLRADRTFPHYDSSLHGNGILRA